MVNVSIVTAYNDQGLLLVGKRNDNGLFTLAAGHINPGETPREAAVRELYEETGLKALSMSYLTQYTTSEGANLYCFSALVSGEPHSANDPDQEVDSGNWEWVDPNKIPSRIAKHLHGPKDVDENLLFRLFNLKKDEDVLPDLVKTEKHLLSDPLISHPNPAERMLALKLNPSPDNLHIASLDHNPLVWQLAVDHPSFNSDLGLKLASAEADSSGAHPGHQIRHVLDKPWLNNDHLRAIYNIADTVKPNDYKQLVNLIGSRPDLEADLWSKSYFNPDLEHGNRLKLLGYENVLPEVLDSAIQEGTRSEKGLDSIELGKKAIEHPNVPQEEVENLVRKAIGTDSEALLSIAAHALAKRKVSEQLINDLQNQAKLRPEHNHAKLRLAALMGPGASRTQLDRAMEDPSQYVRNGLMFAPNASPKHIDGTIARAVKDNDRNGIKGLLNHPTISGKHLNMLIKHESGADYTKVAEMMLGGNLDHHNLKAAGLLAGNTGSGGDYRTYYIQEDADGERAALRAYGIEPNESNIKALRAIKELAGLNKAEHIAPKPESIKNVYPEGEETAEGLKRAFRDEFVFPLQLSGKHSAGAMVARDEAATKSYLLKPSSGGDSPIKGVNEESASMAVREAAFYYIAKLWGLDYWFVESNLIVIDTKEYAVMPLLPWSYETFGRKAKEDPALASKIVSPLINNGIAFQLAVLDYVLADGDRHKNNGMVGPEDQFKLIDNGSSFAGQSFNPGSDPAVFVPFYLIPTIAGFNNMTPAEKFQVMPKTSALINQELIVWLNSLNPTMLGQALDRFGISPEPEIMRLVKLQADAAVRGVDVAIDLAWTS